MRAPPRSRFLLGLLVLAASAANAGPSGDFDAHAATFRREVDNDNAELRLRAFQRVGEIRDPRAVDLLLGGLDKERLRRDVITKAQTDAEAALEGVLSEIEKANAIPPTTPRQIEDYNRKSRKLEGKRDEQYDKLRDLALEMVQERAVLGAGVESLGKVVESLEPDAATAAIDKVTSSWTGVKSVPEERIWWVDVLTAVSRVPTGPVLKKTALDETGDTSVRVAALSARVARKDPGVTEDCVALLASTAWPVVAEAVDGLRRLHVKEGIEPLIAFLGREDIGRMRTDAQRTLRSLTGEKHGPFQQPWADWWKDAKKTFEMPPRPAEYGSLAAADGPAVTFYGVTTFSDRILFVLDVSGSMLDPAHPDATGARAQDRKIDLARRELSSALDMLDEKKKFNMLFFGHKVVRYEGGLAPATKAATERARRFALTLEPTGGTNIHDALESSFKLANAAAADGKTYQPVIDTIFFMTDGTPTAGKVLKPEGILAAVREWNRTAKITIHSIAVGDACDVDFLKKLADENRGDFVKR
jgi:HEAT repeat protein